MSLASKTELKRAAKHLTEHDPLLAMVIQRNGLAELVPHDNYYSALVNSIIGQQLSVKAATSIRGRFLELFGGTMPAPEAILQRSVDELRTVGLSRAKANYIRDLAEHVVDGRLRFDKLDQQTNEEIIAELTDIKGIGEWTAHMFLIFSVGRLDILATGDLGIRSGIRKLYDLPNLPTPQEVIEIAKSNSWHPYESVACWYIWHSLDNKPV